ncbi:RNA polymerase sigma factor [Staphylospora marina]|uniref:RNA polymerase sigma factor n=1 Tax=Staphylospora marina TaxID=2490858 RepID=UPI000F5BEEAD|nr:RNA polymerase sigma factor [Staphylospora marina]
MNIGGSAENPGVDGKSLERLQAVLNRYCLAVTGSDWDAEDLAQDTWLKATGTLRRGHANPEAFLLRIAKNTWIDQVRRKAVLARILNRERPKEALPDHGSFEIEWMFQALMKHLSPLQRTVFLLRDVFGYSSAETAEWLDTTEGAVKAALRRARRSLAAVRDELEKGTLPIPEKEHVKAFLRAVATAYQEGEVARLVELVLRDEADPAMVIGVVQSRALWKPERAGRVEPGRSTRLAA